MSVSPALRWVSGCVLTAALLLLSLIPARAKASELSKGWLLLVPTSQTEETRGKEEAYLHGLCNWMSERGGLGYSQIYVYTSRLSVLARAEQDLIQQIESLEASKPRSENEERESEVTTFHELFATLGSLRANSSIASLCYSRGDSESRPGGERSHASVLLTQFVDVAPHGPGLTYLVMSDLAGLNGRRGFVALRQADFAQAVRHFAARTLAEPEHVLNARAKWTLTSPCPRQDPREQCSFVGGRAELTLEALGGPYLRAQEITLVPARWTVVELRAASIPGAIRIRPHGPAGATLFFLQPGEYRVNAVLSATVGGLAMERTVSFPITVRPRARIATADGLVTELDWRLMGRTTIGAVLPLGTWYSDASIEDLRIVSAEEVAKWVAQRQALIVAQVDEKFAYTWAYYLKSLVNHEELVRFLIDRDATTWCSGVFGQARPLVESVDGPTLDFISLSERWLAVCKEALHGPPPDVQQATGYVLGPPSNATKRGRLLPSKEDVTDVSVPIGTPGRLTDLYPSREQYALALAHGTEVSKPVRVDVQARNPALMSLTTGIGVLVSEKDPDDPDGHTDYGAAIFLRMDLRLFWETLLIGVDTSWALTKDSLEEDDVLPNWGTVGLGLSSCGIGAILNSVDIADRLCRETELRLYVHIFNEDKAGSLALAKGWGPISLYFEQGLVLPEDRPGYVSVRLGVGTNFPW